MNQITQFIKEQEKKFENYLPLLRSFQLELLKKIEEMVENKNKCWCGGGSRSFFKSRAVFHTNECALNNEGYYQSLKDISISILEAIKELEK